MSRWLCVALGHMAGQRQSWTSLPMCQTVSLALAPAPTWSLPEEALIVQESDGIVS